jgi:SAM-dependent methyltransferase
MPADHDIETASPWTLRFADLAPPGSPVLDLACGSGRHTRLFHRRGHPVTAVDRDLGGVADLAMSPGFTLIEADPEADPWPLPGRRYGAVVVCNYLHRPLLPRIVEAVAPGGVLIYETFAVGNERFGRPRNPDFLLHPNELLKAVGDDFIVRAYEHGRVDAPKPAVRQSLCAVRASGEESRTPE